MSVTDMTEESARAAGASDGATDRAGAAMAARAISLAMRRGDAIPGLAVEIAGVTLQAPVMTASGTFGSGMEYEGLVDISRLGAVVTKGVADRPWAGNPTPRIAETTSGMLNAIGLQNPGVDVFLERDLPFLRRYADTTRIIVNVCGHSIEEYVAVVERLSDAPVDMLEINVSCPNVREGGIAFGTDPKALSGITREIRRHTRKPIIIKLSPNVTDIAQMARAAEAEGADALSLINTITGMQIDIYKRSFTLANRTGGLSGPAIKPIAVRMVYEVSHAVSIPVIGMGGICSGEDAVEFLLAGATAVAVGAATFHDPAAATRVLDGIVRFMIDQGVDDVNTLRGAVR